MLIRLLYRARYTDLGPFRAIKFDKLLKLEHERKNIRLDCRDAGEGSQAAATLLRSAGYLSAEDRDI